MLMVVILQPGILLKLQDSRVVFDRMENTSGKKGIFMEATEQTFSYCRGRSDVCNLHGIFEGNIKATK